MPKKTGRVLAAIGRGILRGFTVLMHVGSGLKGGHSTDEAARELYQKPKDFRP